jgi:ABC-type phosphate/phosphonate transport system substrate-binding protein
MFSVKSTARQGNQRAVFLAFLVAALLATQGAAARGQQAGVDLLRIGASGTFTGKADDPKEEAGTKTLRRFIKSETGLNSDIKGQIPWQTLADRMSKGELHLGFFQGYEFAWVQERYPALKPLSIAVTGERYPVACVLTRRDNKARDFAGLRKHSFSIPISCHGFLRLFVERQCKANGVDMEEYFTKIASPDNFEDALDDVVDGIVNATVVDGAALAAYKRRKPGRFKRLTEVTRSQPFPPAVVAYYGTVLDQATLRRFRDGLLGAARKEKGQTLLTLSRLTAFEAVPDDFGAVLTQARRAYPPANPRKD